MTVQLQPIGFDALKGFFQDPRNAFYGLTIPTDTGVALLDEEFNVPGFRFIYFDRDTTATNIKIRFHFEDGPDIGVGSTDFFTIAEGCRRIYITADDAPNTEIKIIMSVNSFISPASGSVPSIDTINTVGVVNSITNLTTLGTITNPVTVNNDGENPIRVIGVNAPGDYVMVRGNQGSSSSAVGVRNIAGDSLYVRNQNTEQLYVRSKLGDYLSTVERQPDYNEMGNATFNDPNNGNFVAMLAAITAGKDFQISSLGYYNGDWVPSNDTFEIQIDTQEIATFDFKTNPSANLPRNIQNVFKSVAGKPVKLLKKGTGGENNGKAMRLCYRHVDPLV